MSDVITVNTVQHQIIVVKNQEININKIKLTNKCYVN